VNRSSDTVAERRGWRDEHTPSRDLAVTSLNQRPPASPDKLTPSHQRQASGYDNVFRLTQANRLARPSEREKASERFESRSCTVSAVTGNESTQRTKRQSSDVAGHSEALAEVAKGFGEGCVAGTVQEVNNQAKSAAQNPSRVLSKGLVEQVA
jgi:hypothetical protein